MPSNSTELAVLDVAGGEGGGPVTGPDAVIHRCIFSRSVVSATLRLRGYQS
jgi:hypothetical protein